MPSPFPGMDPYVESQRWQGFHAAFIVELQTVLVPLVRPRYTVDIEEYILVEQPPEERRRFQPDVTIAEERAGTERRAEGSVAVVSPPALRRPVAVTLPLPTHRRQRNVALRLRETGDVVTVIEVLSPAKKRPGGARDYLDKREKLLLSEAHLVEIDLLRGGERLPTLDPLPPGDTYVLVSRVEQRPVAEGWPWTLREPLPCIPVPLAGDDPDVTLGLQTLFTTVYDRAGYDYSLDYNREPEPPLTPEDAAWARELLAARADGAAAGG
jgi:hypothetical protein